MTSVVNYVLYQLGWLACVLGAANGLAGPGALVGAALVAFHLGLARSRRVELRLVLLAGTLGVAADSLQTAAGTLVFDSAPEGWPGWLAPPWIAVMWAQFATTLRFCFARFQRLPTAWLVALGAVGGPAAYWSGRALGAVEFGTSASVALAGVALAWAVLLPAVLVAARAATRGRYSWDPADDGGQGKNALVRRT